MFGTVTFYIGIPGFHLVFLVCFHSLVLDGFVWKCKIKQRPVSGKFEIFLFLSPHKNIHVL